MTITALRETVDKEIPDSVSFTVPPEFDPAEDTPPNFTVPAINASALCAKDGCPNHVTKPVKGPSPKFCDEHRGTRATTRSIPRASSGSWKRAGEVEIALNKLIEYVGLGVTFVNPVDGSSITKGGPKLARELVILGTTDLKLRRYLELVASPGKYGGLAMAILAMVVPILANHGMLPQLVVNVIDLPENPNK